jgi:hypothetical protein
VFENIFWDLPPPFPRRQYFAEKLFGFWKIFWGGAQMGGAQIFYFTPQPKTTWHGPVRNERTTKKQLIEFQPTLNKP